MASRLRDGYKTDIHPSLSREFGYRNVMEVPRLHKIVVNIGLGEAIREAKALDAAVRDLSVITGQRPIIDRKSVV